MKVTEVTGVTIYVIELDKEEAEILSCLFRNVAGSINSKARSLTDAIGYKLPVGSNDYFSGYVTAIK